jgi:hypothetical protein
VSKDGTVCSIVIAFRYLLVLGGIYSKVKALHASRTYGIAFQEASGGISCTGTCISPKLPPQRVIARLLNHMSHKRHTAVL